MSGNIEKIRNYPWSKPEKLLGWGIAGVIAIAVFYLFGDAVVYGLQNMIDATWLAAKLQISVTAAYFLYLLLMSIVTIPGLRDVVKMLARLPVYAALKTISKKFPIQLERASIQVDEHRNEILDRTIRRLRGYLENANRRIDDAQNRIRELTGMMIAAENIGNVEVDEEAYEANMLIERLKREMQYKAMLTMSIMNAEKTYESNKKHIQQKTITVDFWEEELALTGELSDGLLLVGSISEKKGVEKAMSQENRRQINKQIADNTASAMHSLKRMEPIVKRHNLSKVGAVVEMKERIKELSGGKELDELSTKERRQIIEQIPEINAIPEIAATLKAKKEPGRLHNTGKGDFGNLL